MKSAPLKPIPIPLAERLRQARIRLIPPIVFGGAVVLICLLWRENVAAPTMVGQAEPIMSNVSSHQPGVLAELTVNRFEKVHAGQVLGKVLIADPKMLAASMDVVRAEIDAIKNDPQAYFSAKRYAIDYAQLRLDWMRQRADLADAKAELAFAEVEFRRHEELAKDKFVSQSEYDLAKANFESLQEKVNELARLVEEGESAFNAIRPDDPTPNANHLLSGTLSLQESQLRLAEAELSPIILRAPMDGIITTISNRPGESVVAGQAILTIATLKPVRIVGYLRPPLNIDPVPGMRVAIRTRGMRRHTAEATITEIGTQFEVLPLEMQSALRLATLETGLPVEVGLPPELKLRAGELVDISVLSN